MDTEPPAPAKCRLLKNIFCSKFSTCPFPLPLISAITSSNTNNTLSPLFSILSKTSVIFSKVASSNF